MNKYQNAILEIKKTLGLSSDEIKIELGSVKMIDGTEIKYDKLEVGGTVTIVAEDGSESPLPSGNYELENGFVLEVDDKGIITKYEEMKPVEEEELAEAPVDDKSKESTPSNDLEVKISDLETRVSALEKAMTDALGLTKDVAESQTELSKKLEMATDAKHIKRSSNEEPKNELFDENIKRITQTLKGLKK